MKILIDMGHPAHVHFFKNTIWELERKGHEVKVTAREKDVTLEIYLHPKSYGTFGTFIGFGTVWGAGTNLGDSN